MLDEVEEWWGCFHVYVSLVKMVLFLFKAEVNLFMPQGFFLYSVQFVEHLNTTSKNYFQPHYI